MSRKDYENGEKTYRSRIKICSACLLVIFEESWFRCSTWEVMPRISYRWLLSRNQEDCFEIKYGTFIITNHWFSNRLFPFRARKNSIRKNKHRQQRNVSETETSSLHWFFHVRNSDIRRDEDTMQNLDHTTTLLDIIHAFCHRCCTILRLSHNGSEDDPSRDPVPCCKVDKRASSFLLRMEFMYQTVDAHVYNYVHDTSRPIYRTRERRLRFWPAL